MTLSEELTWRGFVNQTTLTDLKQLDMQKLTFYHGFDASADSQTVGNLAGMMFDRTLMRHGYKAYLLAGGATSLIGDPGGKDSERPLQDEKAIAHNVEQAEKQLHRIFVGQEFTLVNNLDWTKDLSVIHFLRDIGKHFSMTNLLQRDYIARRLGEDGSGISYTEFSYTLLQGMDFLHLFEQYGVTLQVGSSDQWSNCLSGVELIRRVHGAEAHVLTQPLVINKATGRKFGRSEAGAVWLDPDKTSPTQFYQFWINSDDDGVEGYLKIYTELDKPTVDEVMNGHRQNPKKRQAQRRLAQEITRLVHGEAQMVKAEKVTDLLTGKLQVAVLGDASHQDVLEEVRCQIPHVSVVANAEVAAVLVDSGLATSKTEARRLLTDNAVSVNGAKVSRDHFESGDFQNGRLLLRKGKAFKDSALIELTND